MCHSVENEKRMKLFVAGEVCDDPEKWSYEDHMFVIAGSKEEAKKLIDFTSTITEIPMSQSMVFF